MRKGYIMLCSSSPFLFYFIISCAFLHLVSDKFVIFATELRLKSLSSKFICSISLPNCNLETRLMSDSNTRWSCMCCA